MHNGWNEYRLPLHTRLLFPSQELLFSLVFIHIERLKQVLKDFIYALWLPFWNRVANLVSVWSQLPAERASSPQTSVICAKIAPMARVRVLRQLLKRPCIEFGVVRMDSAIVVCIHSAIIQLLLTRRVSYFYPAVLDQNGYGRHSV